MTTQSNKDGQDLIIVGGGVISLTLAIIISEIKPKVKINLIERLDECGQESSKALNNAGTGHAGYCELNYTPEINGKIDVSNALKINEMFENSLQLWAYLDIKYPNFLPKKFLSKSSHISFVRGNKNVSFLKKRYEELCKHNVFRDMEFTTSVKKIKAWAPLLIKKGSKKNTIAATKIDHGTDVNFEELTKQLLSILEKNENFRIFYNNEVCNIKKSSKSGWKAISLNKINKKQTHHTCKKIFIGAGGQSIRLLQRNNLKEIRGYGGLSLSGKWLVCNNPKIIKKHTAKVYGQAAANAPAMSIPHLDLRKIGGQKVLIFGPFAGFTTKFLKHGSYSDLFRSIKFNNISTFIDVCLKSFSLLRYLIGQSLSTRNEMIMQLKNYYPDASEKDWIIIDAGYRVQIIKQDSYRRGFLALGTEIILSDDKSLAAVLGASPGASTAANLMVEVTRKLFPAVRIKTIRNIFPSYGQKTSDDQEPLFHKRKECHQRLGLVSELK